LGTQDTGRSETKQSNTTQHSKLKKGWSDFKGGWGAGVGVKLKFRKRAAEMVNVFNLIRNH
jgi:hypothetical protein